MSSSLTLHGRLPGVLCETALQSQAESPLRLDIAAFVGFAERGPVDTPTAVEDINQYRTIFGGDLLIARQDGQPVYANLPGAVQAFFDNGGRRCYVVRVVGEGARANRFRMPGLVAWYQKDTDAFEDQGAVRTVIDVAASVGRWSNIMSIGTQLRSLPLRISLDATTTWEEKQSLTLELPPTTTLVPGDLLRLQFNGVGGPVHLCSIASVHEQGPALTTTRGVPVTVTATPELAFAKRIVGPLPVPSLIEREIKNGWESLAFIMASLKELPLVDEGYALDLTVSKPIGTGDLLRITCADNRTLLFPVTSVDLGSTSPPPAPSEMNLHLTSQALLWYVSPASVEKLGEMHWEPLPTPLPPLEVLLGRGGECRLHLPSDALVQVGDLLRITCTDNTVVLFPIEDIEVQHRETSPPESTLRLISREPLWLLPSGSPPSHAALGTLTEVDLLSFDLFIREAGLLQESWSELRFSAGPNYWAQRLYDQSKRLQAPADALDPSTAPLYLPLGMTDLPGAGEFSSALPDGDQLASPPDWLSHKDGLDTFNAVDLFLDPRFKTTGVRDLINEANHYLYINPGSQVEPLKKLHSLLEIEEIGLIALPDAIHRPWGPPESTQDKKPNPPPPLPPDWSHFRNCPVPPPPRVVPKQLCLQPFAFKSPDDTGEVPDVRQQLALLPVLTPVNDYQMKQIEQLLAVQKAAVTLCAARADVVAILSLPQHFKRREVLDWQKALQNKLLGVTVNTDDLNTLSYVAVYHPWLQIPETTTPELAPLRAVPPDGASCGMIAARELLRGPWIAPANVPLRGVVALTPVFTKDDWAALFDARINLVRQLPGQFTLMSAHTLSYDNQLLHISVRRLMIFLRKLALRRGMRYVFESNTERFRQRVQASFESTLHALVARGGIIAFEVVTDESINTPNDFDNGRFLIAIKVAPTLPIEFITVILLRSGEDLLNVIER